MSVYDTLPSGVSHEEGYEWKKIELLRFMQHNIGKFFSARQLAKKIGFSGSGTQVSFRKAVTELIVDEGHPIIATHAGFAYAKNQRQIEFYIERLENRKKGLERRIKALQGIWRRMDG